MTTTPETFRTPLEAHAATLATLRRFPTSLVVFLGVIGVAGAVWLVSQLGRTAVAMCGDRQMSPGDICERRSRRTGRFELDYDQVLTQAGQSINGQLLGGAAVVLLMAVVIILVVLRWRKDVAAAEHLTGTHDLLGAAAFPTWRMTGFTGLVAAGAVGGGLLIALRLGGTRSENGLGPATYIVGLIVLIVAVSLVVAGRPRGTTVVQVFPPGLSVLTQSRRTDVALSQAQCRTRLGGTGASNRLSWVGHSSPVGIEDQLMFDSIRQRVNEEQWPVMQQQLAAGQPIDFDGVRIENVALVNKRGSIPLAELAAVQVVINKDVSNYVMRGRGKPLEVETVAIANPDLLFGLLRQHTNAAIILH